jgi:uncharacterized protein Yka (UPF0111/DUF47 family)
MMKGLALPVLWLSLVAVSVSVVWLDRATAAETEPPISELVTNAKTSADQQKLVKWYEQREDEVRHQAELYRRLAQDYGGHRTMTTTACEEIARYYDEIAAQLEKLAEQHRHLAAPGP